MRITAQLIKVSDGFHLWSETYDREMTDIFAVQDEIARSVAGALKVELLGQQVVGVSRSAQNVEAYNAYLQGRFFFERGSQSDLERSVGYYENAVALNPDYAPAWAGLAEARDMQAGMSHVPMAEGYRQARTAAERALVLDPNLADAHAALGSMQMWWDWDWAAADASLHRALALEPQNSRAVRSAAALARALGRFDEAVRLGRRAAELDPLSANAHHTLGHNAYFAGRLDEATVALQKALELAPEHAFARATLVYVYLAQTRPQQALAEAEQEPDLFWRSHGLALAHYALKQKKDSDAALAVMVQGFGGTSAFQIAEVYAYRGEADRALEWLERAYAQRDPGCAMVKGDPLLKNIERDPRYAAF
ncbi:MAG: tetratricopeptide repeat protein, partial [Candidatus Acidiferrales bacterium]